jgi:hypothetical protein
MNSDALIQQLSESLTFNNNIISPLNERQNLKEFDSNLNVINSKNSKKITKDDESKIDKNNFV